ALDPANYRVIASGPDQDIDTLDCGGLEGDDLLLTPASVAFGALPANGEAPGAGGDGDGGDDRVIVQLPALLEDGLYRILVCDSLEDPSGNALEDTFEASFRVSERTLFANGSFDCDLEPWVRESVLSASLAGVGEGFAYSPEDVDGSSLSGSLAVTTSAGSTRFALGQCLDQASSRYDLAARVRVEGLSGVEVAAELRCDLFAEPGCAGESVGESASVVTLTPTGGEWRLLELSAEGGRSAACGLDLERVSGSDFEAFVDRLEARTSLLIDGFEAGDTREWALTVP
ncbi:MAG: hypothetical protein AAF725_24260, partial [Acidobacteriota bacterium]